LGSLRLGPAQVGARWTPRIDVAKGKGTPWEVLTAGRPGAGGARRTLEENEAYERMNLWVKLQGMAAAENREGEAEMAGRRGGGGEPDDSRNADAERQANKLRNCRSRCQYALSLNN
jgi:hypothetical protein